MAIGLGAILTGGFYAAIPVLPVYRELAQRYFCSHPLEYATAGLFFVGIAILLLKALRLRAERSALSARLLSDGELARVINPLQKIEQIEEELDGTPTNLGDTFLVQRIRDVCSYVRGRRSSGGLEEHLKYLAELAAEHLHGSYALVRTITWAVPILGFLGTVIGITMAIANVTPDQLDTSLKEVTGGLAVAFDTTALALALSMVLVFGAFVVERAEQQILAAVEEFGIKQVGCLFPDESAGGPLVQAEIQAAEQLVKKTESLIAWQTRLWQESMETLRTRWTETLDRQQSAFDKAMQEGMAATLGDHAQQLGVMRGELLKGYELVSRDLAASLSKSREAQQQQQEAANRQLGDLWASVHNDICSLQSELRTQTERTVQSMTQQSEVWQVGLKEGTSAIQGQLQEMQKQGEILLCVVEQEEHLARVQELLAENIATVASADTLEETLHSLNAAVHLLTARTRPAA